MSIKGYKAFNPDWTCRGKQYTCPGRFTEDVEPKICDRGIHFCEELKDVFGYYPSSHATKLAEVIAHGTIDTNGNKSCTNDLEIIREITWDEAVKATCTGTDNTNVCNSGNRNSGNCNSGDRNSGDWNSGNWNSGNCNSGNWNSGNYNSGNRNSGHSNSGNRNSGNCNLGHWNSGDSNSGNRNSGNRNSGHSNSGHSNSGNRNSGNCNSGDWNSGDRNSGDWNKSDFNNGCFMTEPPKIMMFNAPTDWTYEKWYYSYAREVMLDFPAARLEWKDTENMTDKEKEAHPEHEYTGGYLCTVQLEETPQEWWDGLLDEQRDAVKDLPNFDAKIFKEITGIEVE